MIMTERKGITRTPREHFMRAVEDELEKFVRREISFQQAERKERAMNLRLPIPGGDRGPGHKPVRV
jgi:hypothetical protein